jgi:hypothetical protein
MLSLMLQVLKNPAGIREALAILERNPAVISNAIQLIDTVQETAKDGKLSTAERNQLTKDFWKFVKSINSA